MTHTTEAPTLILSRLIVSSAGTTVYDESFHAGVNIIRGENSSGKSTIADFIFYGLGGELSRWKPEAQKCDSVFAEVRLNDVVLTLRREISTSARRPMHIFWGSYKDSSSASGSTWQVFPFQKNESKYSYSQVLFRQLGFPDVRGDADNNITMHQLLRLLYVDQLSDIQSLLRPEQFDSSLTRRTIGDLLLGNYDDMLFSWEVDLRDTERRLSEVTSEVKALTSLLVEVEQEINVKKIDQAIFDTEERLVKARARINEIMANESNTPAVSDRSQEFLLAYQNARTAFLTKKNFVDMLRIDIQDSTDFISTLEHKLTSLSQSEIARNALSTIKVSHCPICLNPLTENGSDASCALCKHPFEGEMNKSGLGRIRQEMEFQIRESRELLEIRQKMLETNERELPQLASSVKVAEANLNDELEQSKPRRNSELDDLLTLKGKLELQLEQIHKQARAAALLTKLEQTKSDLSNKASRLAIQIKNARRDQAERGERALAMIDNIACKLLRSDLPHEEEFINAQHVEIDFERNTFSVNGRNQFSASSVVYLKNCVHYAILFASLGLGYIRYPRFILCDNMEDKGMQESRSKNFQELIVRFSNQYNVPFQIIFTTSMISDSLENSPMCIGPHYTKDNKSLSVQH